MDSCIIVISHSNYRIKSAGVEKFISDTTQQIITSGIHVLQIFPVIELNRKIGKDFLGFNYDGSFRGIYPEANMYDDIAELGQKENVAFIGVDVHQVHGWNLEYLEECLSLLDLPINIFVHDYEMLSAKSLMIDKENIIDDEKIRMSSPEGPVSCFGESNLVRFTEINKFLILVAPKVEKIVAPSVVAKKNWCRCFPFLASKTVVREHLEVKGGSIQKKKTHDGPIRIAFLGSTATHKGYLFWKKLVAYFAGNEEYAFFYFGKDENDAFGVENVYVDFQDPDCPSMVDQLLSRDIDIAFLWSTWQETYCFTYYEAVSAGCFVLTNKESGNIQFQVQKCKTGAAFDDFSQCINYLNAYDKVRRILHIYRDTNVLNCYAPNPDIEDLVFEKEGKEISLPNRHKSRKALLLTSLYKAMRGDYK